ncbi:MAG: ribonuclease H-like domain-containing protein [Candidatus Hydrogenedentes bacterium]|nr:ribonuclease H-like domain-containing protein [Candidatus Hydrogenedentota bacterium]
MSDIKDRIQSLLRNHQGLMAGSDWRVRLEELSRQREAGEFEIDKVVPGELRGEGDDHFYHTQQDFPLDYLQGDIHLGSALEAIPEHIALAACDPDLDGFDPSTAVFVDTETTGLSGGTGTMAFLVGVGYFTGDCFRLEQCFMRDFDEEEPMLRYLDGLFARAEAVVTYNGKSFDLPLLRTRFISNRIPFRLDSAVHFDLLHASRRFWKQRLRDCSLGNVERVVLGVQRLGDVNSAEIPEIWFDYLRTRDARKLERVFYHHKHDILSLAALTGWLSRWCISARNDSRTWLARRTRCSKRKQARRCVTNAWNLQVTPVDACKTGRGYGRTGNSCSRSSRAACRPGLNS